MHLLVIWVVTSLLSFACNYNN